jgi:hypothetical protein
MVDSFEHLRGLAMIPAWLAEEIAARKAEIPLGVRMGREDGPGEVRRLKIDAAPVVHVYQPKDSMPYPLAKKCGRPKGSRPQRTRANDKCPGHNGGEHSWKETTPCSRTGHERVRCIHCATTRQTKPTMKLKGAS